MTYRGYLSQILIELFIIQFCISFSFLSYRKTPNLVTATEPGTKIKFSGLVAVTKCLCVCGGGVQFRLLGRPKTRKSRFLGLFYDLFWTRYKYRNYCSYLSKYWLLSKTNKCNHFLMPIILQTHIFKVINHDISRLFVANFDRTFYNLVLHLFFFSLLPENPEFGHGYRTWNKNKIFGFGSRHQVFVCVWGGCTISPFGAS